MEDMKVIECTLRFASEILIHDWNQFLELAKENNIKTVFHWKTFYAFPLRGVPITCRQR